ncbi:MAG: threonine synthase, partial [Clostridia bacterium]|nr:threonine synthase [Clostridia bacterium]
ALQAQLVETGRFTISDDMKAKMSDLFWGGFCDDTATLETIGKTFREDGYLCDTHTAVAVNVCGQYRKATGDGRPCVIASTASPYKFADRVLSAVGDDHKTNDEFGQVRRLSELTHTAIPAPIAALENAHVRFKEVCEKAQMTQAVCRALEIQ